MAPGDLDPSFGTNGIVTTDFDTDFGFTTRIFRILVEPNGRIVAAGIASSNLPGGAPTVATGALARYSRNGRLDPTFGRRVLRSSRRGTLLFNFVADVDPLAGGSRIFGLARQNDGKLIVVGESLAPGGAQVFSAARLNMPDGSHDGNFGEGGFSQIDFASSLSFARDVVIRDDGGCVVAGSALKQDTDQDFALAAFDQLGSLDFSFGELGKVITNLGSSNEIAFSIVVQPDNKIVVGGQFGNRIPAESKFALARYDATTGILDPTFGDNGMVKTDFGLGDTLLGLAVQPNDGKIIAVGTHSIPPFGPVNSRAALARYNTDGSLDPEFGNGGKVLECLGPVNNCGRADCAALQPDGKIVVGGGGLARFNTDGTLDQTFGAGGKATLPDGVGVSSAAIQGDGKILVGGGRNSPDGHSDFALLRYLA
jgi:uncharacterized delta-60 repeat protein